jgi:hypothetical protein
MNKDSHTFSQPIQVIQLHRKQARYGKEEKARFDLKAFQQWKCPGSFGGLVENGKLFLNGSLLAKSTEVQGFDLLVVVDDQLETKPSELHFLRTSSVNSIEIFKISGKDPLELHLEWSYFSIGDPSRNPMKLCDLVPGKAYEIRINGKTDFSLSGRRPRHYLEQAFIVEHLGTFSECTLISAAEKTPAKQLPDHRKIIDLRKPLW